MRGVVIEVGGNGRCSASVPSKCVLKRTSAYWINGTMPKSRTICKGMRGRLLGFGGRVSISNCCLIEVLVVVGYIRLIFMLV